jgi:flagellar hook protein FlgE
VPIVINTNQTAGDPTTTMNLGVNLPATYTVAGSTAVPPPLSVEYFGNLGTSESLEVTFTPGGPGHRIVEPMDHADPRQRQRWRHADRRIHPDLRRFARAAGGTLASVTVVSGGAYDPATGTLA